MRLTFTRLVDSRIRIITRSSEIPDVPEQMPLGILHQQIPELRPDFQKRLRRLAPGPTLDGQSSY